MFRWLDKFTKQILAAISNFADLLDLLLKVPFKTIGGSNTRGLTKWIQIPFRFVFYIVLLVIRFAIFPFQFASYATKAKKEDLWWSVPAFLVLCVLMILFARVFIQYGAISDEYVIEARNAIRYQDFPLAKICYERALDSPSELTDQDRLNWIIALEQTGNQSRAYAELDRLAPDVGDPENPKFHLIKANVLLSNLGKKTDPSVYPKIRRHLQHAGQADSLAVNELWVRYYASLNDSTAALPYAIKAAQHNPAYWLVAAGMQKQLGLDAERKKSLESAATELESRLVATPENTQLRILVNRAQVGLGRYQDAENLILAGINIEKLESDPTQNSADLEALRVALVETLLSHHDHLVVTDPKNTYSKQFELIEKAMKTNINHPRIYDRIIAQTLRQEDKERSAEFQALLENKIASGGSVALACFALGNLHWMQGEFDRARELTERAWELDEFMVVAANNLAMMIAYSEEPELDRAFELASEVVERFPENGSFRDTLGIVLMKQGKFERAIDEFLRAISSVNDRKAVNRNLAICYTRLNKLQDAKIHLGDTGRALEFNQSFPTVGDLRFLAELANAYLHIGQTDTAGNYLGIFDGLISDLKPTQELAPIFEQVANCYSQLNQAEQASRFKKLADESRKIKN